MPARILPSVLLPAPFSPMSAWQLPRSTSKVTASSANTPGNRRVIFLKARKDIFSRPSPPMDTGENHLELSSIEFMTCWSNSFGELLAQPAGTICGDAIHAGGDQFPRSDRRINRPDVNFQAGDFQSSDHPLVHRATRVQIDAIESGLSGGGDQLIDPGHAASGLPIAPERANPA